MTHTAETTITYQTTKAGTLTKRGQAKALADLAVLEAEAKAMLAEFAAAPDNVDDDAWNGTHDALAAIEAEAHRVRCNFAPIRVYSSEWLALHNID